MYQFTDELKERIVFFLKFSAQKWQLESLQKGNLYLNTVEHFRRVEEETQKKGMGDDNEGRLILSNVNYKIYNKETGNLVLTGLSKQSTITMQEDSEKHLLCLAYIGFSNLKIVEEGKDYINAQVVFTDEQKREFEESFGRHVLVLSSNDFINNLNLNFESQGLEWTADKVKYSDYLVNYKDRLEPFIYNNTNKFFWKDTCFQNQKEYRIAVLNRDSNEPFITQVDDMTRYSLLTTTEELFNNKYYVQVRFNPETDLIPL